MSIFRGTDQVIIDLLESNNEIISKIKSYNTKIIVVSAYDLPNTERKLIQNGADFFLLKPFGMDELVKIIKELVSDSVEE